MRETIFPLWYSFFMQDTHSKQQPEKVPIHHLCLSELSWALFSALDTMVVFSMAVILAAWIFLLYKNAVMNILTEWKADFHIYGNVLYDILVALYDVFTSKQWSA